MNNERDLVLVEIQTERGTAATPDGADAVAAYEITQPTFESEALERGMAMSYLGSKDKFIVTKGQKLTFKTELRGSGTKGTPPQISKLLRACRMTEVITADTSVEYKFNSTDDHELVTIYYFKDDVLYKLVDACGTAKIECKAGAFASVQFDMTGSYAKPVDSAPPAPTVSAVIPPRFESAGVQFDSLAIAIETLSIDFANEVVQRVDANKANGIDGYKITGRDPKLNIDPEMVSIATKDIYGIWDSSEKKAFQTTFGSDGNKIIMSAPKAQLINIGHGDRNKIVTNNLECELKPNAGNDEFVLRFE